MTYDVTNDDEDVLISTEDMTEAIRVATETAQLGPVGNLVLIESEGYGIKQFMLTEDGTVIEIDCV